jgi:hypothetical protein
VFSFARLQPAGNRGATRASGKILYNEKHFIVHWKMCQRKYSGFRSRSVCRRRASGTVVKNRKRRFSKDAVYSAYGQPAGRGEHFEKAKALKNLRFLFQPIVKLHSKIQESRKNALNRKRGLAESARVLKNLWFIIPVGICLLPRCRSISIWRISIQSTCCHLWRQKNVDQLHANEAQKKRGGVLKWVLIGCGGSLVIAAAVTAVLVYMLSKGVSTDAAKAEGIAREILLFEKPARYKGMFSLSMMGVKSAMLMESEGRGAILLMTFQSQGSNREDIERRVSAVMEKQGWSWAANSNKRAVETFNVRGKEAMAEVGVVAGKNGAEDTLQYTLALESSVGSPLIMMIYGNEKTITHEWIQTLLDSVQ